MISVVTWKWQPPKHRPVGFTARDVNRLKAAVDRHYPHPHRFVCITDEADGLDSEIEAVPIWRDLAKVRSQNMGSCYRRLKAFSPGFARIAGERFVSLDLDAVVVGDLSPLWNRAEDLVICEGTASGSTPYNGSMFLHTTGTRKQLWDDFDPVGTPIATNEAEIIGSDQAWIAHSLGPSEQVWTTADGVYSYPQHLRRATALPENARIIFFRADSTGFRPQNVPWLANFGPF